uniref:WD repeat-containing protein 75 n=1 Tax=Romanomermis culicivorax TaxID=13658 RepID=A0A915I6H7_ROMCU
MSTSSLAKMTNLDSSDLLFSQCSSTINSNCCICIDKLNKCIFCCVGNVVRIYNIASGDCLNELNHPAKLMAVYLNPTNFLQTWNLKRTTVAYFPFRKNNCVGLVVLANDNNGFSAYQLSLDNEEIRLSQIAVDLPRNSKEISCDLQGNYLCYVRNMKLFVKSLTDKRKASHNLIAKLVCITCHPSKEFIATGDINGLITLWHNFFDARPVQRRFHWHSSSVEDITFPTEAELEYEHFLNFPGSSMYSGGIECVAVKWSLQSSQKQETKEFLSRLDGPIVKIASSPDNKILALVLADNSIRIASSQMKIQSSIKLFAHSSWFRSVFHDLKTFPIGLHYDSNGLLERLTQNCLVVNAMPGHLQFYNPKTDRVTYTHDVVNRNLPPKEAGTCSDVISLDFQNRWMATVEYRRRPGSYATTDFALKFWYYDEKTEKLELNTIIENPHRDRITSLKFRPVLCKKDEMDPTVATTSIDGSVKVWTLAEVKDIHSTRKLTWLCDGSLCYRKKAAHYCQFSKNGKVLCAAYGGTATFWNFDDRNLLISLLVADGSDFVKQIEFGQSKKDTKLICFLTKSGKCSIWDIECQIRLWAFDASISLLVADKNTGVFAAFSSDMVLYFKPSNENLITSLRYNLQQVFGACFAPSEMDYDDLPPLYVLCHDQTIWRICTKNQQEKLRFHLVHNANETESLTALATVLTETRLEKFGDGKESFVDTRYLDTVSKLEMLNAPAHTLPSIQILGMNFIKSCLQPKVQNINEPKNCIPVPSSDVQATKVEEKVSNAESQLKIKQFISLSRRKLMFLESYFQSL